MENLSINGSSCNLRIRRSLEHLIPSAKIAPTFQKEDHIMEAESIEITDTNSIDRNVKLMDSRYKTSFHGWLKEESNCDIITTHLKRIISDYDLNSQKKALVWLFQNWDFRNVATCLIKLYYERGINRNFAEIVSEICVGKPWEWVEKIVMALIIGEKEETVGEFLYLVTEKWSIDTVCELIMGISEKSQWNSDYLKRIICSIAMNSNLYREEKTTISVENLFNSRSEAISKMESSAFEQKFCPKFQDYAAIVLRDLIIEDRQRCSISPKILREETLSSPVRQFQEFEKSTSTSIISSPISLKSPILSQPGDLFE